MKEFRHVYKMGGGFIFRLTLPGHRFVSEEIQDSAEDAAFYCDVMKCHLASTYRLTGYSLTRSLAPARFAEMLSLAGVSQEDVSPLLPFSCREYLANGGNETITEHMGRQAALRSAKPFPTQ